LLLFLLTNYVTTFAHQPIRYRSVLEKYTVPELFDNDQWSFFCCNVERDYCFSLILARRWFLFFRRGRCHCYWHWLFFLQRRLCWRRYAKSKM